MVCVNRETNIRSLQNSCNFDIALRILKQKVLKVPLLKRTLISSLSFNMLRLGCKPFIQLWIIIRAPNEKTNKKIYPPSHDSGQPGHAPSLIRVFAISMKKHWVLSYPLSTLRRLWSDWANAQADPSLPWVHMQFCWFSCAVAHITRDWHEWAWAQQNK